MRCAPMQERSDRETGFRRKATGSILIALGAIGLVTAGAVWQLPAEGTPAVEAGEAAEAESTAVEGTAPLKASVPFLAGLGLTAVVAGGILWRVGDKATSDRQDRPGRGGWTGPL